MAYVDAPRWASPDSARVGGSWSGLSYVRPLDRPMLAAGPYGVREIGSKSDKRAPRPSAIYWFFRSCLVGLPLLRSSSCFPHLPDSFFAFRFSPFAARSGGSRTRRSPFSRPRPSAPSCWRAPPRPIFGLRANIGSVISPPDRVLDDRHCSHDQEPPEIAAHLRYPAQPRLAAGGMLPTRPSQAEKSRPRRKLFGGAKACSAIAVIGPMPGIVISRAVSSHSRRPGVSGESVDQSSSSPIRPRSSRPSSTTASAGHSSRPRASRPAAGSGPCPAEHDAVLGEVTPERVDRLRALPHQQVTCVKEHRRHRCAVSDLTATKSWSPRCAASGSFRGSSLVALEP